MKEMLREMQESRIIGKFGRETKGQPVKVTFKSEVKSKEILRQTQKQSNK